LEAAHYGSGGPTKSFGTHPETLRRLLPLAETSGRQASTYDIKDIDAHRALLQELAFGRDVVFSPPLFDPRASTIPQDAEASWKVGRKKISALADLLQ
jgi:hypothetical protein